MEISSNEVLVEIKEILGEIKKLLQKQNKKDLLNNQNKPKER
jgi:hypothetical protein